jgi:hypothetical protein
MHGAEKRMFSETRMKRALRVHAVSYAIDDCVNSPGMDSMDSGVPAGQNPQVIRNRILMKTAKLLILLEPARRLELRTY